MSDDFKDKWDIPYDIPPVEPGNRKTVPLILSHPHPKDDRTILKEIKSQLGYSRIGRNNV